MAESIAGGKGEKILFVVCNLALAAVWLRFLIRLISRWNVLPANIRDGTGLFMMFFSLLWITLIRGKRGAVSILIAGAVFMTVVEIVRTFM